MLKTTVKFGNDRNIKINLTLKKSQILTMEWWMFFIMITGSLVIWTFAGLLIYHICNHRSSTTHDRPSMQIRIRSAETAELETRQIREITDLEKGLDSNFDKDQDIELQEAVTKAAVDAVPDLDTAAAQREYSSEHTLSPPTSPLHNRQVTPLHDREDDTENALQFHDDHEPLSENAVKLESTEKQQDTSTTHLKSTMRCVCGCDRIESMICVKCHELCVKCQDCHRNQTISKCVCDKIEDKEVNAHWPMDLDEHSLGDSGYQTECNELSLQQFEDSPPSLPKMSSIPEDVPCEPWQNTGINQSSRYSVRRDHDQKISSKNGSLRKEDTILDEPPRERCYTDVNQSNSFNANQSSRQSFCNESGCAVALHDHDNGNGQIQTLKGQLETSMDIIGELSLQLSRSKCETPRNSKCETPESQDDVNSVDSVHPVISYKDKEIESLQKELEESQKMYEELHKEFLHEECMELSECREGRELEDKYSSESLKKELIELGGESAECKFLQIKNHLEYAMHEAEQFDQPQFRRENRVDGEFSDQRCASQFGGKIDFLQNAENIRRHLQRVRDPQFRGWRSNWKPIERQSHVTSMQQIPVEGSGYLPSTKKQPKRKEKHKSNKNTFGRINQVLCDDNDVPEVRGLSFADIKGERGQKKRIRRQVLDKYLDDSVCKTKLSHSV